MFYSPMIFFRILIAESYSDVKTIQRFYTNGTAKGAHLVSNFQLIKLLNEDSTAQEVIDAINSWINVMHEGHTANWVIGNHEHSRAASRNGREKTQLFNTLIALLPGTSITYYVCIFKTLN